MLGKGSQNDQLEKGTPLRLGKRIPSEVWEGDLPRLGLVRQDRPNFLSLPHIIRNLAFPKTAYLAL